MIHDQFFPQPIQVIINLLRDTIFCDTVQIEGIYRIAHHKENGYVPMKTLVIYQCTVEYDGNKAPLLIFRYGRQVYVAEGRLIPLGLDFYFVTLRNAFNIDQKPTNLRKLIPHVLKLRHTEDELLSTKVKRLGRGKRFKYNDHSFKSVTILPDTVIGWAYLLNIRNNEGSHIVTLHSKTTSWLSYVERATQKGMSWLGHLTK